MSERDSLKLTGKEKREFKRENLDSLKKLEQDQKSETFKEKFEKFKSDQQKEIEEFYSNKFTADKTVWLPETLKDYNEDLNSLNLQLSEFEKELKEEIGIVQTDLTVLGYDVLKNQFLETAVLLGDFDLDGDVEVAPKLQDFSRKNKIWANLFGKNKERKYDKAIKNSDVYVNTEDGKKLLSVFGTQISMTYNEVSKVLPEETIKTNISTFYEATKNEPFGSFDKSNPNLKKLHALFQEFPNDITEIMSKGFVVIDKGVDPVVKTDVISNPVDYTDPLNLEAALSRGGYPEKFKQDAKLKLGSLFVDGSGAKAGISALAQYDITTIGKNGHLSVYPGIINGTPGLAVAITGPLKNGDRFDVTGTVGFVWPLMSVFGGVDTNLDVSSNVRIDGNARKKIGNVVSVSTGALGFAVADTFYLSKDKAEGIESDYQLIKKESTAQYLSQAFESIPAGSDNKAAKEALKKYLLDKQEKEISVTDGQTTDTDSNKKDKKDKKEKKDKNVTFSEKAAEDTAGYLADVYSATGGSLDADQIRSVTDTYADLWKNDQNARASRFGVTGLGVGLICWNGLVFPTASVRLTTRKLRYNDNQSANRRNVNTVQNGGNAIEAGRNFATSFEKYNKMLEIQGADKLVLELDDEGKTIVLNNPLSTKTVIAIAPGVEGTTEDRVLKISKDTKTALVATNEQFGAKYMLVVGNDVVPDSFEGYWTNQGKKDMSDLTSKLKPITEKPAEVKIDLPEELQDGKIYKSAGGEIYVIKGTKVFKKNADTSKYNEVENATVITKGGKVSIEIKNAVTGGSETIDIKKATRVKIENLPKVETGKSAYEIGVLKGNLRKEYNKFGHALDQQDDASAKKLLKTTLKTLVPAIKDVDSLTHEQLLSIGAELSATKEASAKNYNSKNERFTTYDQFRSEVLTLWGKNPDKVVLDYLDGKVQDPVAVWNKQIYPALDGKTNQAKLISMLRPFPLIVSERNDDLAKRVKDPTILSQLNIARASAMRGLELSGNAWYLGSREGGHGSVASDNTNGGDIGFTFGYGRVDGKPEVDEKIVTNPYYWGKKDIIPTENKELCKYTLEQTFQKSDILSQGIKSSLFASDASVTIDAIEAAVLAGMDGVKKGSDVGLVGSYDGAKGVIEFVINGVPYILTGAFEFTYFGDCFNETLLIQDIAVAKKSDVVVPNGPTVIPVNPVVPNAPTDTDGNIYILNNQTMTQLVEGHAVVGGMGKPIGGDFQTQITDGNFQTEIRPGQKTDTKITSTGETGKRFGVVTPSTGETGSQINQTNGGVIGDTGAGIANRNLLDKNN